MWNTDPTGARQARERRGYVRPFARIHGSRNASRLGKILTATIIAPGATCTRLQDMWRPHVTAIREPVGRTLDPQPAPVQHVCVDLRGFDGFVPEPERDDGAIHARLEEIEGHRVTQDVDGDPLVCQRRADLGGRRAMSAQPVLHAVGAETRASGVREHHLPVTSWWFA